jgi:hypothetical protein
MSHGARAETQERAKPSQQRTQEITNPILEAATSDLTVMHLRLTLFAFAGQMLPNTRSFTG